MKLWGPDDLDEIISYGDINYRRQVNKLRTHAVIKPPAIKFKVYTSRAKIFTEIGVRTVRGLFDAANTKDLVNNVQEFINEFSSIIFTYCGQSYAIWKHQNAFYIFNSEDTDANGKLVLRSTGSCCVVRAPESIEQVVDYLVNTLRIPKKCYEIYSFKINQKTTLEEEMIKLQQKVEIEKALKKTASKKDLTKEKQMCFAAVMCERKPELVLGEQFLSSSLTSHRFLISSEFLTKAPDDTRRSPFISSAAIAMLRLYKSSQWKTTTMAEIFMIGRKMFEDNVAKIMIEREAERLQQVKDHQVAEPPKVVEVVDDPVDDDEDDEKLPKVVKKVKKEKAKLPEPIEKQPDIPITQIRPIFQLKNQNLEIHAENIVFGKVLKRGQDVISLEDGIKVFFKSFDCGLIQGPDVVAIWREKNYFFMFDPNQCNGYRRSTDKEFNSCLSSFKDVNDLVKLYVENLAKELRNSIFKIAKVEIFEHDKKSKDWQRFKAIGKNKWILPGTISESSPMFYETNRNHQSTCISAVALAKTRELGVQSWTQETVDEIVQTGDEFYSSCISNIEEAIDPNLTLSEIGTELKLDKTLIDFLFDDCVINGTLQSSDGSNLSLTEGLATFFEDDELGVVTSCGISLAVWKLEEAFYLFDSHNRDEKGRNLKAIGEFLTQLTI